MIIIVVSNYAGYAGRLRSRGSQVEKLPISRSREVTIVILGVRRETFGFTAGIPDRLLR